ncbi:MAG TPA: hypothetical protein VFZ48_01165 [Candidatus Saccharimonadales bacterium]
MKSLIPTAIFRHKLLVISIALVLALAVGALIIGLQGNNFANSMQQTITQSKSKVAVKLDAMTDQLKSKDTRNKIAGLLAVKAELKDSITCEESQQWWQFTVQYGQATAECALHRKESMALMKGVSDLVDLLQYDMDTRAVLAPALGVKTTEEKLFTAHRNIWRAARDAQQSAKPPEAARTVNDTLIRDLSATVQGWDALISANRAHDAAAFSKAQKTLAKTYDNFPVRAAEFESSLQAAERHLLTAYSAFIN